MLAPWAIWSHVYLKSVAVIGCPSDHAAFGLSWYVTTWLPATVDSVGGAAMSTLGWYTHCPPRETMSNTRGMVCSSIVHTPQVSPAHESIQSAQLGSCSAPMVISPRGAARGRVGADRAGAGAARTEAQSAPSAAATARRSQRGEFTPRPPCPVRPKDRAT